VKEPLVIKAMGRKTANNLSKDTPQSADYWQALSLDALAEAQGIGPMDDITVLFGTWPGDQDDGFEDAVASLRKRDLIGVKLGIDY
jgi:hypothetical protein